MNINLTNQDFVVKDGFLNININIALDKLMENGLVKLDRKSVV